MRIPIVIDNQDKTKYDPFIEKLPSLKFDNRVAIVTNPTVAKFHLQKVLDSIKAPLVEAC